MFQQRTWILQRSNIEILRECQRLVLDLFSERLSLAQNDLIEKIFYFASQSQSKPLDEAVEKLKHSLTEAAFDLSSLPDYDDNDQVQASEALAIPGEDGAHDSVVEPQVQPTSKRTRIYRGREVIVEPPPADSVVDSALPQKLVEGEPLEGKAKPKRIYRGRVVG